MSSSLWPLFVLLPCGGIYFYFKLTVKDLTENWAALVKDGIASGLAFVIVGVTFFWAYPAGWLHWLGLVMALWSITYWASAAISYQNLQTEKRGGQVQSPLNRKPSTTPSTARPNRAQRRSGKKKY